MADATYGRPTRVDRIGAGPRFDYDGVSIGDRPDLLLRDQLSSSSRSEASAAGKDAVHELDGVAVGDHVGLSARRARSCTMLP
ncbi:MAG: hypothetical protein RMA76_11220 [Deltaproteobacteria bacterium]|jgi:hypothetical protein